MIKAITPSRMMQKETKRTKHIIIIITHTDPNPSFRGGCLTTRSFDPFVPFSFLITTDLSANIIQQSSFIGRGSTITLIEFVTDYGTHQRRIQERSAIISSE
jgi:hypothetical protein